MDATQYLGGPNFKKEDLGSAVLLTISGTEEVCFDDGAKLVLSFRESDRRLPLNTTRLRAVIEVAASGETEDWIGRQIVVYWDPTVEYQGRATGGVRVRRSRRPQPDVPPAGYEARAPLQREEDGGPF